MEDSENKSPEGERNENISAAVSEEKSWWGESQKRGSHANLSDHDPGRRLRGLSWRFALSECDKRSRRQQSGIYGGWNCVYCAGRGVCGKRT